MIRLPVRHLSFSLASLLLVGACNSTKSTGSPPKNPEVVTHALRVTSVPVRSAVVGEPVRYRVTANVAGAEVKASQVPTRATVDASGNLSWTPGTDETGEQKLSFVVTAGEETVNHEFTVRAARATVEASEPVDPNSAVTQTVAVRAPTAATRGAAVQIEPGSMPGTTEQTLTISSIDDAPVPPAARVARMPAEELVPVELGPSGMAFRKPARVQLPVTEAAAKRLGNKHPDVQTYDYATGRWSKIKVLSFDAVNRLVIAEVNHFSTYVATPPVALIAPTASRGGAACGGSLIVRAPLVVPFSELPGDVVNGGGKAATVAAALAGMDVGQTLQVYTHVDAEGLAGGGAAKGWMLATATKVQDGHQVRVTSHGQAAPFMQIPDVVRDVAAVESFLSGARSHVVLGGLALDRGVRVGVDVSLYIVGGAEGTRPPAVAVNTLATEQLSVETLAVDGAATAGFDEDCDGAPNAFDMSPRDEARPELVGTPGSPVRVLVGADARLGVKANMADLAYSWSATDPSLVIAADGAAATIKPQLPGSFQVEVAAHKGTAVARFVWNVVVDRLQAQAVNTAPAVAIAAEARVARVGERVKLLAVGKDKEQAELSYGWSLRGGGALSAAAGESVSFSALEPGDYQIECVASDGLATSAPAVVTLSILPATTNRPPEAPVVTPLAAQLTHAPGETVSLAYKTMAVDPDGDPVTFEIVPDADVPRTVMLSAAGASATVTTASDGVFTFFFVARDPKGAMSPLTAVRLQVTPKVADQAPDADKDGFPAGVDCDDRRPDVFPGNKDICGDGVDQNCDGHDVPADECDADGDRHSVAKGDCDDRDSKRNPSAPEVCDGVDNDCDGETDDGFGIGKSCTAGEGGCAVSGRFVCDASGSTVICGGAVVGQASAETCDGLDNDCNGKIDDVAVVGNDVGSCGGCNLKCPAGPFSVAACDRGGCVSRCEGGHVDLDGSPDNGCECALTNKGVEACDGVDNDCNGRVDDGAAETFYPGPAGTSGVGACTDGVRACDGGQVIVTKPARVPAPEVCDGLDNDCNGKVDELPECDNGGGPAPPLPVVCKDPAPAACQDAKGATFCTNFETDPTNCGACGKQCPLDHECQRRTCVPKTAGQPPACVAPAATCKDASGKEVCTDLGRDGANCGACGILCTRDTVCDGGKCVVATEPPPVTCVSPLLACTISTRVACVDVQKDSSNCGACGVACPADMHCEASKCVLNPTTPACAAPRTLCKDMAGIENCVDTLRDGAHCGACLAACKTSERCDLGKCVGMATPTCAGAETLCKDATSREYCANLALDNANCGACGGVCPTDQHCDAGKCLAGAPVLMCTRPLEICKGPQNQDVCVDLNRDGQHCGACGTVCPTDAYCDAGKCVPRTTTAMMCPVPEVSCMDASGKPFCTDPNRDPSNCGRCGVVCGASETCLAGVCAAMRL